MWLSKDKSYIPSWTWTIPMILMIYFNKYWYFLKLPNEIINDMTMISFSYLIGLISWLILNFIVGYLKKISNKDR